MTLTDVLAPLRRPRAAAPVTPVDRTGAPGSGGGAPRVRPAARRPPCTAPLFTRPGAHAGAGPQTVRTALAAYGRWTWTHGGGPGAPVPPVRSTTRIAGTRPLAARAVGTPARTSRYRSRAEPTRTGRRFVQITGSRDDPLGAPAAVDERPAAGRHRTAPPPEKR
ncbi:hypothetical protein [Streptomyces sp. NPDC056796]|uniref:hypothetical protein n=1 Tax=Streptomyces sp. NPDC056796 TaxID=3345947 RepID=UPI0036C30A57